MEPSRGGGGSLEGRVLAGKYQLLGVIGRGGMGVVYEAMQLELARRVAIKVLRGDSLDVDERAVARFRQEALLVASVVHPNVVQVTDLVTNEEDVPAAIVMEHLEGEALATVLRREGKLSKGRAVAIVLQLLAGLGAAHEKGIVHRDVKPSNVFLIKPKHGPELVKVVDFGIAKSLDAGGYRTTTGLVLGTPAYMAPEQIRGQPVDARTDVHAAAACLVQMLTGDPPIGKITGPEVARAILELSPAHAVASIEDKSIAAVIAKALAHDRDARWENANAMAAALAAAASATATISSPRIPTIDVGAPKKPALVSAPPPPRSSSRRSRQLFVAVTLATIVLGGLFVTLIVVWAGQRNPDKLVTHAVDVDASSDDGGNAVADDQEWVEGDGSIHPVSSSRRAISPSTSRSAQRAPTQHGAVLLDGDSYAECVCAEPPGGRDNDLSYIARTCYCFPPNTTWSGAYKANALCPQAIRPNDGGAPTCVREKQLPDPGDFSKSNGVCEASQIDRDAGTVTPIKGKIQCFADYNPRPGVQGAACKGFSFKDGIKHVDGRLRCDPFGGKSPYVQSPPLKPDGQRLP